MTPIASMKISRQEFDTALIRCFRAIYKFEQTKVRQFGLNFDAIFLLQFLRRNSPSTMGAISREMQTPISTATRMVDRLIAKDVISREKDPKDKRIVLVSLEPKGEHMVQAVEDNSFDIISKNLTGFDADEIKGFFKTALSMGKILEIPDSP